MRTKIIVPSLAAGLLGLSLIPPASAQDAAGVLVQSAICYDSDGDRVPCGAYLRSAPQYYSDEEDDDASAPQSYWDNSDDDDQNDDDGG